MPYKFSRKTAIILLITVIAGFALYTVAPPEIEPGLYSARLEITSSGITITETYNLTLQTTGTDSTEEYILVGSSTNVTVTVPVIVVIATDNPLTFTLNATGDSIAASDIVLTLTNQDGFNLLLRPNRQSGQVFIIGYQPLVNSRAAVMILTVVAILWFTEGISLVATSLMIPVLIVLSDIRTPQAALAPFFDPAVVLIFGGFLICYFYKLILFRN